MELTEAAIDVLEAGEETDRLVAERVMGWKLFEHERWGRPPGRVSLILDPIPAYSTTWQGAGMVWEALPHERRIHEYKAGEVGVMCLGHSYGASSSFEHVVSATAETLPLAICRAALKVKLLG